MSVESHKVPLSHHLNAPSIPHNASSFGYEETENGNLIQHKNPEKGFAGTLGDAVGPGQYNANVISKRLGINWHKSRTKRFSFSFKHEDSIGPGVYSEIKVESKIDYNAKGTSCFLSKVKRPDMRGVIKKVEEKLPGPGQYNARTSLGQKVNFNLAQQFGTCAPRFVQPKHNSFLGPGKYNDNRKTSVSNRSKVLAK